MADASSPNVKDSSDQAFMADVIEASQAQPVLVDFWAPWCGPCRTLGPAIERAVDAKAGKVKLVKINIDENPGIAGQLGVRSIPAVFAFRGGQPVDGFMGALPESQITQFIDKLLSGTDEGAEIAEALDAAREAAQAGDNDTAAQLYAAVIQRDQENVEAVSGLARCYLAIGDADRARATLDMVPEAKRNSSAYKSALLAIEMASEAPEDGELAEAENAVAKDPTDDEARLALAEAYAAKGRSQDAADHLLLILAKDMQALDGKAKAKLLEIFEAAGPDAAVTVEGRKRLSSLMFA